MRQHGAVTLVQHIGTHTDRVLGGDTQYFRVKGTMVQLAERQTIAHLSTAALAVSNDVGSIQ